MRKRLLLIIFSLCAGFLFAQKNKAYTDSLNKFRADYIASHEVVTGDNKKNFRFFPIDRSFSVQADFEESKDKPEVKFKTFAGFGQRYLLYGKLHFKYKGRPYQLSVYFSPKESTMEKYKDHLFIPFTDLTNGNLTYGGGRYVDILTTDIKNGKVIIDFNKNYNPWQTLFSAKSPGGDVA